MVDVAGARVVAVLTRAPSSGGKSRLFAALGCAADAGLLSALLLDTLDGAALPGVARVVVVTPSSARGEIVSLVPPDVGVIPQVEGDLGQRMRGAFASLFEHGASAVVLIGSDVPDITPAPIDTAFQTLEREPDALVLGPAADGGYYLIGAARVPEVFDGIEWGSPEVLAQTKDAATASGIRVSLLDVLGDVDTAVDLRRAAAGGMARRTAAWVLMKDGRQ